MGTKALAPVDCPQCKQPRIITATGIVCEKCDTMEPGTAERLDALRAKYPDRANDYGLPLKPGDKCRKCKGDGMEECDNCDGTGWDVCGHCDSEIECAECDGTGELECEECDGTGEIQE